MATVIDEELINQKIFILRGMKVMLSTHLAELYEVEPRALIQAVKRNLDRFPLDFMFQLTWEDMERGSRSQNVILNRGQNVKYLPYAFTEQGVAMLSCVLKSGRAVQVNIEIMRVFVRLRQILSSNKELSRRLDELEKKYDGQFKMVFDAIRQLMAPPPYKARKIVFSRE